MSNVIVNKVNEFTFLGGGGGNLVPGSSSDVKRIAYFSAFGILKKKYRNEKTIKVCIYYALIVQIVIYTGEVWNFKEEEKGLYSKHFSQD